MPAIWPPCSRAPHSAVKGVNVLIYGAPGTGKTEFAKGNHGARRRRAVREAECFDREGQSLRQGNAIARCRCRNPS